MPGYLLTRDLGVFRKTLDVVAATSSQWLQLCFITILPQSVAKNEKG